MALKAKTPVRANIFQYIYWMIAWITLRPMLEIFCHFKIRGTENLINLEKPFIFVMASHANRLDPWIVSAAVPLSLNRKLVQIRYMTYYKYIEAPIVGQFIKGYGAYPVEPGQGFEKVLEPSIKMLENKEAIGLFPEGGLSKDGLLREGKVGAAYLSAKTNAPIIPVYLGGNFGLNPLTILTFKQKVTVCFGKPMYKNDLFKSDDTTQDDLKEATKLIMGEISSLSKL